MMKYLLVLAVVLFAVWLWKHNRRQEARERAAEKAAHQTPPAPPPVASVARMVACRHCGLHLPEADAVSGQHGRYCSEAHRQALEG